ncbi:MAG: phosphoribosylanthranilate isomerase [Pseudomonadota bacterium]
MSGWIKICGLNSDKAVATAVAAGVDAVGFVFHPGSPRHVEPMIAALLAMALPSSIQCIAVTRNPSQQAIDDILEEFEPDALQTDAEDFERLLLPPGLVRLPVLRTGAILPAGMPARCLYESAESGRGAVADWEEARVFASRTQLVLAGGLTPANVAAAISQVQPFGVDVSTGVETAPGRKDPERIREFVTAARAAFAS